MKFKKAIFLIVFLSLIAVLTTTVPHKTQAQISPCGTSVLQKATGLVATPKITGSFVTSSGACVVDPRAGFAPFKIPGYDDLKSLYFTQSKLTKSTITSIPVSFSADGLYQVTGDLIVSSNPTGTGTQLIFVGGNLNISQNYTYGSNQSGTVFIVKGNVNIDPAVTRIDAVIIAGGTIYTAGASCILDATPDSQLTIYGSLISLTDTAPPKFCRTLDPAAAINNNNNPAEKINHQVKYLVILRNLMSDTLQRWSEIP